MEMDGVQIKRRNLPHWTSSECDYFITFRAAAEPFSAAERQIVLTHIRSGHGVFYFLIAAVVMPDHVHLLLRPNLGIELPRIMKGIKGVSARLINAARRTSGRVWQDESYDRIIRDAAELAEKIRYMVNNPLEAGLVSNIDDYAGLYVNPEAI